MKNSNVKEELFITLLLKKSTRKKKREMKKISVMCSKAGKAPIIAAIVLALVAGICLWLTTPDYAHLSSEKAFHHTYKEAAAYAAEKYEDAEVSRRATKKNGYKIWDAEINGVKCQIASKPVVVLGIDRLNNMHSTNYYQLTDNYDYRIAEEILTRYPELGTLKTDEESMFDATNLNAYITGAEDFSTLNESYKKVLKELEERHVEHLFWVDINDGEYTLMPFAFGFQSSDWVCSRKTV